MRDFVVSLYDALKTSTNDTRKAIGGLPEILIVTVNGPLRKAIVACSPKDNACIKPTFNGDYNEGKIDKDIYQITI